MAVQNTKPSALPDGLRYYLLRGNGMVPLVPVDQLPFQLQGVPRHLTHRQMSDESWKLLQETEQPATPLPIQAPTNTQPSTLTPASKPRFLAPDHHIRAECTTPTDQSPKPSRWSLLPPSATERAPGQPGAMSNVVHERPSSLTDNFAAIYQKDAQRVGYGMHYPSGIEPDQSKKEFCTHWIKTGECAFISVGCKYKHEMPAIVKLRELGFTQLPKWWKEKSAITSRGPTWMQRRLASGSDEQDIPNEMPAPRAFPDPSTFRKGQPEASVVPQGEHKHERSMLKSEAMCEPTGAFRVSAPLAPSQEAAMRRESQISNLLIDLDETPAPPPSPQLSGKSSTSGGSSRTRDRSSCASESSPPSPRVDCVKPTLRKCSPHPTISNEKREAKSKTRLPIIRRYSLVSSASEGDDEVPPVKPLSKRKSAPRRTTGRENAPANQPGLAISKHAQGSNLVKNTRATSKNAKRRMQQQKVNEVAATELHSKIDQLRRNTHQRERTKKETTGLIGATSGAAPSKQTAN